MTLIALLGVNSDGHDSHIKIWQHLAEIQKNNAKKKMSIGGSLEDNLYEMAKHNFWEKLEISNSKCLLKYFKTLSTELV